MNLDAKIREAEEIIITGLVGNFEHPRVMSSFGKDSLVLLDLLRRYGITDTLYLDDLDEVQDPEHRKRITEFYDLKVVQLPRGRALFTVVNGEPLFYAMVPVGGKHFIPVPTTVTKALKPAVFFCMDDALRDSERGQDLPVETDLLFLGFKLSDITSTSCHTHVANLSPRLVEDYVESMREKGPHQTVGGLPFCFPLFH